MDRRNFLGLAAAPILVSVGRVELRAEDEALGAAAQTLLNGAFDVDRAGLFCEAELSFDGGRVISERLPLHRTERGFCPPHDRIPFFAVPPEMGELRSAHVSLYAGEELLCRTRVATLNLVANGGDFCLGPVEITLGEP